ncbi:MULTISPECIES: hypothetical protein [unclassified Bacillus (in: firmicutes)]|uniref:hypothetical protein n=1 Tax=unclassified Bacillus (in: firmicutes) TaxID=185979 RepID=UPI00047CD8A6|nr:MULTISPECIES: hypothetical protein [unclassified Bacillus (in: firmicutes)]SDZ43464.1 hypothetical protein SAMN04488156_13814 [Bacillus sp. 166amftsu]
MKNYDVINHAVDVLGAQNDLVKCISDLENHRKNLRSIKTVLADRWDGNTSKEVERRLTELESELAYRIDAFRNIEGDLEKYRKAVEGLSNQFMMMGPKY